MKDLKTVTTTALLLLLLAGCNSGEDFSDGTSAQGRVITGGGSDPLDPEQDAVEIELVATVQTAGGMRPAVVTNIGYTCGQVDTFVPAVAPGEPGNLAGLPENVARCPLDAEEIRFFIGRRPVDSGRRFYIGKTRIPRCSGRQTADCSGSPGFYQFAIGDLVDAPSRVASNGLSVSTRAALLSVLDAYNSTSSLDGSDDLTLEIPNEAHDITSSQFDVLVPSSASGGVYDASGYGNYAEFSSDFASNGWDDWRAAIETAVQDAIDNNGADYSPLPNAWPAESDIQDGARLAAGRVRAGVYQFVHNSPLALEYIAAFPDQLRYQRMSLVVTFLAMPDGTVVGAGPITVTPLKADGPDAGTEPDLDGANTVSDLAILSGGSFLDEELFFGGPGSSVSLRSFFKYGAQPTDLEISGRLLGPAMYDGLAVAQSDDSADRVDYTEDYPVAEGEDSYNLLDVGNESARGRVSGVLLGDNANLFEHPDGIGIRAAKTAFVGSSLDASITEDLPPFYRLTFWKACVSDSSTSLPIETSACGPIPANEIGVDEAGNTQYENYEARLPGDNPPVTGDFEVTQEQRRQFEPGDAGEVGLQILSDGRVVTDLDQDCSDVDGVTLVDGSDGAGQIQEYQVGFITRTLENADTGGRSANIIVYLAGDADRADVDQPGYIPQFGSLVQGRVDLGTELSPDTVAPIYRLSDSSFDNEVRAGWLDIFQSRALQEDPAYDENQPIYEREFIALSAGAVEGRAQYPDGLGGCQSSPPGP